MKNAIFCAVFSLLFVFSASAQVTPTITLDAAACKIKIEHKGVVNEIASVKFDYAYDASANYVAIRNNLDQWIFRGKTTAVIVNGATGAAIVPHLEAFVTLCATAGSSGGGGGGTTTDHATRTQLDTSNARLNRLLQKPQEGTSALVITETSTTGSITGANFYWVCITNVGTADGTLTVGGNTITLRPTETYREDMTLDRQDNRVVNISDVAYDATGTTFHISRKTKL